MLEVKKGRYLHWKGKEYEVMAVVKHSETLEELVLYKRIGEEQLWVRPKKIFLENVEMNGKPIPRFKYKGEK